MEEEAPVNDGSVPTRKEFRNGWLIVSPGEMRGAIPIEATCPARDCNHAVEGRLS